MLDAPHLNHRPVAATCSFEVHIVHPGAYLQCTTYLVRGPDGAVLVDPGSGAEEAAVLAGIAQAGGTPDEIRALLLTHAHVDHALGAGRWQRRWNVPLCASAATAAVLRRADPQIWAEHPALIRPIDVSTQVADGECLRLARLDVECLATPGHTAGCTSYVLEADNSVVAFTGDLLMPNPRHPGWAGGPGFSVERTLASLERLLARGVTAAYTGHGPVPGNAQEWLRQGLEYGQRGAWVLSRASGAPTVPVGLQPAQGVA